MILSDPMFQKYIILCTLIDENEAMDSFMRLKMAHKNQLLLRGLQLESTSQELFKGFFWPQVWDISLTRLDNAT